MCFHVSSWTLFFFFNDTATTEIYTLSLHDALPISTALGWCFAAVKTLLGIGLIWGVVGLVQENHPLLAGWLRSEEHTSELQSQSNLVCRLLLEKKKRIEIVTDSPTTYVQF